ncbi:solute carrier family 51 subunit beta [Heterodontus francisci]|uniref:solute carrier family 51 subunit beta n=1 Tax=Heterodontus francisci TaxID=7792 RepID=UPI00355B42AA
MYELKRDQFGWLILCVLLQGVEVFIIKSSDNQCLEASLESNLVLTDRCNPDLQLQDWVWKQNWLFNQGNQRCLSADQTLNVQTATCENVTSLIWICTNRRLVHRASSLYLIAEGNLVLISKEKKKNSKWSSVNNTRICEMSFQENPLVTAKAQMLAREFEETDVETISNVRQHETQEEETTTAKQISYVIEDSTNWNYSMLGLAFIALFLGFLILALSSSANKKKKIKALNDAKDKNATESESLQKMMVQYTDEIDNTAETDQMLQTKQAYISMNQALQSSSPKISPKPGEIVIEWKDGNISSLFRNAKEDDV